MISPVKDHTFVPIFFKLNVDTNDLYYCTNATQATQELILQTGER